MTLDEFFEKNEAGRFLLAGLKANEEVYCKEMILEDREALMRCNLIMIRQWFEAFNEGRTYEFFKRFRNK